MNKFHIFVFKIKHNLFSIIFLIFIICLVLYSSNCIEATKSGLKLWANSLLPSLFPFLIAIELLSYTNITKYFGLICNKIMKPFFNVSGSGSYALIMGMLSGYPIGAKIVVDLRNKNICTKEECERLLSFTNNSNPLFIITACRN